MSHPDATAEPGGADEISAARDALAGESEPLDSPRDRAVPNLPARDFDATVAFYGAFGFSVEHRDGGWLILRRGGVLLEFFLAPELDPYSSWFMASIRIADLEGLYAAIRASGVPEGIRGVPRLVPIAPQEWGQRAGFLIDLDGTQLHLIENRR